MDIVERDVSLARLRHPGIAFPGQVPEGPLLADVVLRMEEVAAVFAVLATTLADLRDLGVSLGPLSPSGVVVAPDGRPVIADLSGAAAVERGSDQEAAEVRNLGMMLSRRVRRVGPERAPAGRRLRWSRRPRSLAEEVDRWAAAAERGSPTLRQLADGLVHPEARLPRPGALGEQRRDPEVAADREGPADRAAASAPAHVQPRWWRWPAVTALAMLGVGLTVSGILGWRAPQRPRIATTTRSDPGGAALCLAFTPSGGCASPATYAAGVLRSPAGRFAVGRPADVLAAGRWSCRADPTLALLRPDRGEVWVFPGWPGRSAPPVTAHLATRIAQARLLGVRQVGGCDALVVTRADSTSVVLDPAVLR
ncbi:MAG: hypothetical protein NVS1B12_11620 [Acidimicrobiales bacterium]